MNEKQLKDFREMRNDVRKLKREMSTQRAETTSLYENISIIDSEIESIRVSLDNHETRIEALESSGNGGDLPATMLSLQDLRRFVDHRYYDQARRYYPDGEEFKRELCKSIRDHLIQVYPNIDYAPEWIEKDDYNRRHFDAFYEMTSGKIIDFVKASSGGGRLIDKLIWLPVD
jgi:hypothetical protein